MSDRQGQFPVSREPWQRFNRTLLAVGVLVFAFAAGWNVLVDPWGVFRVGLLPDGPSTNERIRKVEALAVAPARYDAFLVGSSRMGLYRPADAAALWPDSRWYNLAVFSGDAGDAEAMLRALALRGVAVRRIVFGIDLFPFLSPSGRDRFAMRNHPAVSGESWTRIYGDYLFAPSILDGAIKLAHSVRSIPEIKFRFEAGGQYELPLRQAQRIADPAGYARAHLGCAAGEALDYPIDSQALGQLAGFLRWLDSQGIELRAFIHPAHRCGNLARVSRRTRAALVRAILELTGPIPNYLGRADWANADRRWLDVEHYDADLGREILEDLRRVGPALRPPPVRDVPDDTARTPSKPSAIPRGTPWGDCRVCRHFQDGRCGMLEHYPVPVPIESARAAPGWPLLRLVMREGERDGQANRLLRHRDRESLARIIDELGILEDDPRSCGARFPVANRRGRVAQTGGGRLRRFRVERGGSVQHRCSLPPTAWRTSQEGPERLGQGEDGLWFGGPHDAQIRPSSATCYSSGCGDIGRQLACSQESRPPSREMGASFRKSFPSSPRGRPGGLADRSGGCPQMGHRNVD